MRLLIAQMKHETNTFSPVPTPLARFAHGGSRPYEGDEIREAFTGTGTAIGAFLDLAEKAGASVVLPVAGNAAPSGPVARDAYEYLTGRIVDAAAKGCDAILLDLHGAMVPEGLDDGEGELLRRIRVVAPQVPIGVALDMHTNLFPAMAEHATVLAGYQTYPHVDMFETGQRAARPILAMLEGRARPAMAFGHRPMLPHVMRQSSLDSPNREIQARARQMEASGTLAATFFVGFPHADIPFAGASAVVVTDGEAARARRECDELLDIAWRDRAAFVYAIEPLEKSIERAARIDARPVVLLDHYDNCASGGTMDTMTVLGAMLDAGLEDAAAFAIFDPQAVKQMQAAGAGANVTLELGGRLDMPALGLKGKPRTVSGMVKRLVDGRYRNEGPMAKGERGDMGPSALLDTGRIEIAVISRHVEPYDMGSFRALGMDPAKKRYLMLKSRVHWRAGLGPLAKAVVECAGTGVCTSDYSQLHFRRVRRPVFPLDAER
ncbi:MAG: microcystin degradation protein MlrC [Betaproteobacteria bacterium RIFCSPLOWO2_02_FULL_66_14]|nr:MAG: microcystin degradation protein MlrC [Betaproteobacteria bacterium RIFCSPLOWO2_02_FULL_66_14]